MNEINLGHLFEINYLIDQTFFSNLDKKFEVPKEIKDTHIKTLIIIKYGNIMTMSEISASLGLVKGAFTPVAKRLIDGDYIKKTPHPTDKRSSYLDLTEEGDIFITALLDALSDNVKNKMNYLNDDEKEAYFAAMTYVLSTTRKISALSKKSNA